MNQISQCYCRTLQVYSASSRQKNDINNGNSILLPLSSLKDICKIYRGALTFKLQSDLDEKKSIYVGVLEFTADKGTCVVPDWIFDAMGFTNGLKIPITFESINTLGRLIKVQPHKTAFIQLPDPKYILKSYLKNFTCLTQNETISIKYQDVNYLIDIVKVEPINEFNAICISQFELDIDFMDPLDMDVTKILIIQNSSSEAQQEKIIIQEQQPVFQGTGIRIDGQPLSINQSSSQKEDIPVKQYDPRKQKLVHGLKQAYPNFFNGPSVKWGNGKTNYNILDNYHHELTTI
ncbi:unnamed protein product [Paramecium octaurelia]|uniref:Ubiquitin fusion degradation protein n=1 Tax=Paramecium octaurelia TaxID=43137 RepID=A0A8S1TIX0_PAROT|nr:unnamed protein product [Paramecium octaurelia]